MLAGGALAVDWFNGSSLAASFKAVSETTRPLHVTHQSNGPVATKGPEDQATPTEKTLEQVLSTVFWASPQAICIDGAEH